MMQNGLKISGRLTNWATNVPTNLIKLCVDFVQMTLLLLIIFLRNSWPIKDLVEVLLFERNYVRPKGMSFTSLQLLLLWFLLISEGPKINLRELKAIVERLIGY